MSPNVLFGREPQRPAFAKATDGQAQRHEGVCWCVYASDVPFWRACLNGSICFMIGSGSSFNGLCPRISPVHVRGHGCVRMSPFQGCNTKSISTATQRRSNAHYLVQMSCQRLEACKFHSIISALKLR